MNQNSKLKIIAYSMQTDEKRQAVHILLILLAFFLKYLTKLQAAGLLLLLLVIVLVLVPRLKIKHYFYRQHENHYSYGAVLYFLTLLILVLVFPLSVVATAWAVLALGDGTATLIGKNFKVNELPWNRKKSYFGTLSFIFFGALGAFIMMQWLGIGGDRVWSISFKTAIIAALVESLPWRINDNVSVAVASAITLSILL